MNNDETQLYQEWKGFLQQSSRLDVRWAAIQAVYEHPTNIPDHVWAQGVVPLIHFDEEAPVQSNQITLKALQCLQYISQDTFPDWVDSLWTRLLELALSRSPSSSQQQQLWRQCVHATCALLANLSREEAGAIALVGTTLPEEAVYRSQEEQQQDTTTTTTTTRVKPTLELLVSRFLSLQYNISTTQDDDPYEHMAGVLMNLTQVELGRRFLLKLHTTSSSNNNNTTTTTSSMLQTLLPQLQSPNTTRRCGIAGMCRNLCMAEPDSVDWLLHTVDITTHLLLPLAGPEELDVDEKQGLDPALWLWVGPDKEREPNGTTRLYLVEAVLALLKTSRAARHVLRLKRVYVILKYADMVEEDERVSEQIYECVNYLRGDEEGLGEGSSDRAVAAAYPELKGGAVVVPVRVEDYDQVD